MASERLHSPGDDVDDDPYTPPALPDDADRPNLLAVAFAIAALVICAALAIVATGYAIGLARG